MSTHCYLHGDWLFHYYQHYYRSSRQGYFSASTSLAIASVIAVSLTPSQPAGETITRVSAFLGGLAFGAFLLASVALLYASVHDEQTLAALAYERELADKDAKGAPLGGSWHRSILSAKMYKRRGVPVTRDPQLQQQQQQQQQQEESPLLARWHERSKEELYRRRKNSFILAIAGRYLLMAGVLLLTASLACIAKFKITGTSNEATGLWIALLVVLSIVGGAIIVLVGYQDVHSELFNPGPAPIQVRLGD